MPPRGRPERKANLRARATFEDVSSLILAVTGGIQAVL